MTTGSMADAAKKVGEARGDPKKLYEHAHELYEQSGRFDDAGQALAEAAAIYEEQSAEALEAEED